LIGGIHPSRTLPIVLDVGTNNRERLNDPEYLGWRHERVTGHEYLDFVDRFVKAVKQELPMSRRVSDVSTEYLEFSFGPFRLIPERQLLVGGEEAVNLGTRGLELLHGLVEHSGEVVSKDELITHIWPDTCVSESNLKVRMAALRRALGEGRRGDRYIATVSGRGNTVPVIKNARSRG
jgi:DNA-binding response OmpR family regulator